MAVFLVVGLEVVVGMDATGAPVGFAESGLFVGMAVTDLALGFAVVGVFVGGFSGAHLLGGWVGT